MRFASASTAARVVTLLAALLCAGCLATPKPASSILPVSLTTGVLKECGKNSALLPVEYWKPTSKPSAAEKLVAGSRVVITEFDVEFIDLQLQSGLGPQVAFKLPPIILGPFSPLTGVGIGLQLSGLGRKNARLTEDEQQNLSGVLLAAFEKDMRHRGLQVIAHQAAAASLGYADLKTKRSLKSSPIMLFNLLGNDTGIVMHSRTVPAPGLGIVACRNSKRARAITRILDDTAADVAVAVRLRVGVFRKKAALQQDSSIQLCTRDTETTYEAQHSILSDDDAIGASHFRLLIGDVETVLPDEFARELAKMLPTFLDLAIREPQPQPIGELGKVPESMRLPPVADMPISAHP